MTDRLEGAGLSDDADPSRSSLGALQSAVLQDLWRHGESSVREVVTRLNEGGLDLAYTTVLTVMVRLAGRGFLTRRRVGRADVYRAAIAPEKLSGAISREAVDRLLRAHGEAAVNAFAARMLEGDPAQLARMRRLLEQEGE